MPFGNVVDQLHDDDGLADACPSESTDLTPLGEGTDQINDLDSGLQNLGLGVLIDQRRRAAMDGKCFIKLHWATLIDRLAKHVEDTSQHTFPDGNGDRPAECTHFHAAP